MVAACGSPARLSPDASGIDAGTRADARTGPEPERDAGGGGDPTCDACYVAPRTPNTCTLLQSCTSASDCSDTWITEHTCEAGRCVPHDRTCDSDASCRTWCRDFYGAAADTVCDGSHVPRCESDPCNPGARRCTLLEGCSSAADCTNTWETVHRCEGGRCIPEDRFCTSNDQCRTWCYEFYGAAASSVCDSMHVPRCEPDPCEGGRSRCTLLRACATAADCQDTWTHEHTCEGGRCIPHERSCGATSQCRDWCLDFYGTAGSTVCDATYVPRCE